MTLINWLLTPDFSGLPGFEKLILEDCIRLVQIHESIGDFQRLLILNLKNYTSLMELPKEMSILNSLQELVLGGCSNLDSLMNMVLEHHQGRTLLQSDGIVASTSYITSLPLKLFFPYRFPARKKLRFTSFSLPLSLESLDLSGTPIRFLPESIKDLGPLRHLYLRNCKMLQTFPELPSHLYSLDVSFCCSLQRLANLFTRFYEEEEEDKWLIQNEFVDNFSFKISSPPAHRICGFNLFTRFCMTSGYSGSSHVYLEIRNNTSGRSLRRQAYIFPMSYKRGVHEFQ